MPVSFHKSIMVKDLSLSTYGLVGFLLIAVALLLYRAALPKPIPGIPYNKTSANRILGDASELQKWRAQKKEIWSYMAKLVVDLNAPVIQMFIRPFGKPWVIISDFRESQDIQMSRSNEFDRAQFIGDLMKPLGPNHHVWMPTGDEFRAHRYLIKDSMSPSFLSNTAGPAIHTSMQNILALWKEKMRLAQGRPFSAEYDVFRGTVDIILAATFGFEVGAVTSQTKLLCSLDKVNTSANMDEAVIFPAVADPEEYVSITNLVDSVEIALNSPLPRQHLGFALKFYPSLVSARKYKDNMIGARLQAAWKKFADNADRDDEVKSVADLLVQRESLMAKKDKRDVFYDTPVIRDELYGFLQAGHETTSTSVCWNLKFLTEYQNVQQKLRLTLKTMHSRAARAGELPTAQEIAKANVPYLDAFIEESHRLGNTIPAVVRQATKDTVILGHPIPKGTDVFMIMNGPSYQLPAFEVDESKRSRSSQESKVKYGVWDPADVREFIPERWLVRDEKGNIKFDPRAGPVLPYGVGVRGCFGTKLAVLELKIIVTLVVWSFELQTTPPELSSFEGYDKNTHRPQQLYLRLMGAK